MQPEETLETGDRAPRRGQHDALAAILDAPARRAAVEATALLDSPPEEAFDRLTRLASRLLGAPTAVVSIVDRERQFFKSSVGLPEGMRESPLQHSFCRHVVGSGQPFVVGNARREPLVADSMFVRDLGVMAYVGVPLNTPDGHALGSLCVIDTQPREWTEYAVDVLKELAALATTEIRLRLLARAYHADYVGLRQLEMQRNELVHMLVHDLRNPLLSVMGGLELIEEGGGGPSSRDVALARDGANALLHMINDILDVSKADAGKLALERTEVAPAALVAGAMGQIEHLASAKRVRLVMDVGGELPVMDVDRAKLQRVFVNLLANAVQHTDRGGQVTVAGRMGVEADRIAFEVMDTGVGIPREAFDRIFEKFGQVETRGHGRMSTGLGLPFARMVVEAHGGEIGVESELGRGTTFRLILPVR